MIQHIRELINSVEVGWYSSKGNKCFRQKKYEKALNYYFCALNYKKKNFATDAYLRQNIAYAYEQLGSFEEAMKNAQMSIELYERLGDSPIISAAKNQMVELIEKLKQNRL